jgi:gamma-glutamyltranspeptidase / glutathione hydrolase
MRIIMALFLTTLLLAVVTFSQDRQTGKSFSSRSEVIAQNGIAATRHPLATQVAIEILKQGGSAVDAAIAANAMLGVVAPMSCGIGGDLFAIVWDEETQKLYGINASGRSPKSLTREYFIENGYESIPLRGPLPVSVPGAVDGWFELHEKFGRIEMEEILAPAIRYAREGHPVHELIAYYFKQSESLSDFTNFSQTYMPNGRMPVKGEIFKNPDLANTYEKIAHEGRDAFYKGEIAHTVAKFIEDQGGFLSYEDLVTHTSDWVEPVSTNYRGYDVWQLPPNGQGIATLQILNIMEGYDVKTMGFGSPDYIHHFVEAKKLAFEDRAYFYADLDFTDIPIDWLISKEYADERRKLIDPRSASRRYDPGNPDTSNTIILAVADKDRNMISLIQSNYYGMGSGMVPYGLGFVLQNRGAGFNIEEGYSNTYEPNKRPFHTIIPGFITKDGDPFICFGVKGGDFQPLGQAQIVMNIIDFGMNLQEAGDAPRISHSGSSQPTGEEMIDGGSIHLETGFGWETIRALIQRGHTIEWLLGGYGGYQAIMYDKENDVYFGASEFRKDGQAAGY